VFDACNIYLHQAWTDANDKITVKDCIAIDSTQHSGGSQRKGAGSQLWGTGSVIGGSGSQIIGAGSEIRRDPPNLTPVNDICVPIRRSTACRLWLGQWRSRLGCSFDTIADPTRQSTGIWILYNNKWLINPSKCKSTDQVLYLCSQLMYLYKSCIALNIVLQKLMNTTLTIQRVTVCTYEMNNC